MDNVSDLELIKITQYVPQSTRCKKYDSGPQGGLGALSRCQSFGGVSNRAIIESVVISKELH